MSDALDKILAADKKVKQTASEYSETVNRAARNDSTTAPERPHNPWPVIAEEAFHGLAGEFVRAIEPHTEADRVALLASFLAEFAVMIGRGPHLVLDGARHPLLIYPVLVGRTSKSRKGSSGKRIKAIFEKSDPSWTRGRYKGTLSSGEGLVWAVRDPEWETNKKTGETVLADEGVTDKRLLLIQSEFGVVLRVMSRDGNSLTGVIRDSWDGEDLAPMTKSCRIRATAPHIGIIGHVTKDELLRNLSDTEASNGFGNRFIWLLVRRSKELPFPTEPEASAINPLIAQLHEVIEEMKMTGIIGISNDAKMVWRAVYAKLSADRPGLAGSLLNRSEAYTMRFSALFALLDRKVTIEPEHLQASLAFWDYAEQSTYLIFGSNSGDPIADAILKALERQGELTETQIRDLFSRHVSAERLAAAKEMLRGNGKVTSEIVNTGGRPVTVWRSDGNATKAI